MKNMKKMLAFCLSIIMLLNTVLPAYASEITKSVDTVWVIQSIEPISGAQMTVPNGTVKGKLVMPQHVSAQVYNQADEKKTVEKRELTVVWEERAKKPYQPKKADIYSFLAKLPGEYAIGEGVTEPEILVTVSPEAAQGQTGSKGADKVNETYAAETNTAETNAAETNTAATNAIETEIQSDFESEEKNTEMQTERQTTNSEAATEADKNKVSNKESPLKGSELPEDMTGNQDVKRDLVLKYKMIGQEGLIDLKKNDVISDLTKIEHLEARYHFVLADNETNGQPNRTMKAGDYYFVDLPQEARIKDEFQAGGEMLQVDGIPVAKWEVLNQDGKFRIKVTFAEIVDDMGEFDINGNFTFRFGLDGKDLGPDTKKIIQFPIDGANSLDITVTNPPLPETTLAKLEKKQQSYDEKTREITYKVTMLTKSGAPGVWEGCAITDTLDTNYLKLKSIKHGSIDLAENTDYTYDKGTGQIEYKIPAGRDGTDFKDITIVTQVRADAYADSGRIMIENTASALEPKSGDTITSNKVTTPVVNKWISKKGSSIEGNRIKWEITINENHQNLYNATMTDRLGAELTLDENTFMVDGNPLVQGNPDSTGSYYEVTGQEITYHFGQGKADSSKHLITFVTDVKPLVNGDTSTEKEYTNTAKLTAEYEGDDGNTVVLEPQIGTIGVGVPTVYVIKTAQNMTASDKKDGTLFWKIQVASNLETYGQSTIADTIPTGMRDKYSFIDGEVYIGGMDDSNKIINVSDAHAVFSDTDDDSKNDKITITFLKDNALAKIQTIYVKTKLTEAFYGKNILNNTDGKVTNDVTAALYKADVTSEKEASGDYTGSASVQNKVIQKSAATYYGNNSGQGQSLRMNYSIKINENQMPQKNAVVTDNLKQIETWVDATDDNKTNYVQKTELNAGWKYVPGSLVITRIDGSADSLDLENIAANAADTDDILTIKMGDYEDCYVLTFTAELDVAQDESLQKNSIVQCRGNTADITAGGLNGTISTAPVISSPTMKNEVLKKTGSYDANTQQATWSIRMNQHQFSLKNTTMIDHFPKGLTLDPTSIKLYKNVIDSKGDFLADNKLNSAVLEDKSQYSYTTKTETDGSQIFAFSMKQDNTAYILQFATDIEKNLLGTSISNEAYYSGDEGGSEERNTGKVDVGSAAGGSSTRKGMITIQKKDAETSADLSGAVFELKWLPTGEEPVVIRQLATDKGKVTFFGLALGETYSLTEVKAPDGYAIDDKTPKEFTVASKGGEQSIAGKTDNTFTNSPVKSGTAVISASKKLMGHAQTAGQFSFDMFDETNTKVASGTTGAPLASGDSNIIFTPLDSDNNPFMIQDNHIFRADEAVGTTFEASRKTYKIKESGTAPAGYIYDTKEYEVTIVATNEKGKKELKMEVLLGTAAVTAMKPLVFTNVYKAAGNISLTAQKVLNGHSLTEDNKFTFELYAEGEAVPLKSVENGIDGSVTFKDLEYTQDDIGEKVYIIKERIPAENPKDGYTYDTQKFKVKVVVADNHNGTLKTQITEINGAAPSDTNKIVFTNTYKTSDAKLQLNAKKILNGRTLADAQFLFKLEVLDADGSPITGKTQEKKNSADGAVKFDEFSYTQADIGKTFTYRLTEIAGDAAGYAYDSTEYLITAAVKDNNAGTMQVELTGSKVKDKITTAVPNPKTELVFENSYEATGKLNLTANKTLTGRTLGENQFSFSVKEIKAVKADDAELASGSNASDGTITFSTINYTLNKDTTPLGEHTYIVRELKGSASGYTYDDKEYTVKVMVSDNGDGTLNSDITSIKLKDNDAEVMQFDNTYKASGILTIQGTKFLNGRALADKQFDFELKDETGKVLETVSNGQTGEFKFSDLKYTEKDAGKTYKYTVAEKNKAAAGYTYDGSVYTLTVKVTDDGGSHMTAGAALTKDGKSVEGNAITFTNTYKANGSFTPIAKKTLTGRILEDEQFTFTLKNKDGAIIETVKNHGVEGDVTFKTFKYTESDADKTYTYMIEEVDQDAAGYTYDGTVYQLNISVTDDGKGKMDTAAVWTKVGSPDPATAANFTNIYHAKGSYTPTAKKTLAGAILEEEQFSFTLKDKEGKIIETVKNDGHGDVVFPTFDYTEADAGKSYTYTIEETDQDAAGYTYDGTVYQLDISVTDNGDGKMNAADVWTKVGSPNEVTQAVFTNEYKAEGSLILHANKLLSGHTLKAEQFAFVVKEGNKKVAEGSNDGNGSIVFSKINYTLDKNSSPLGEHIYTVQELKGSAAGYTYDTGIYTVKAMVSDNKDGTLKTEILSMMRGDKKVTSLEFENTYRASGRLEIQGTKFLNGHTLADEQFTFELKDKAGKILETTVNDKDGKFKFPELVYSESDAGKTFTYTISEKNLSEKGYTYDDSVYTLTVSVSDDNKGHLTAESVLTMDEKEVKGNAITFTNEYKSEGNLIINAQKTLNGASLKENQFSFTLKDKDGVLVETVKNNSNGVIAFSSISFTEKDADKTFIYTVQEVIGKETGYTYDQATYKVTVKVTDAGKGKLEFNTVYETGQREQKSILFTNTYKKPVTNTPVTPTAPKKAPTTVNTNKNADSAKTDDNSPIIPYTAAGLAALAVMIVGLKRRRKISE